MLCMSVCVTPPAFRAPSCTTCSASSRTSLSPLQIWSLQCVTRDFPWCVTPLGTHSYCLLLPSIHISFHCKHNSMLNRALPV